MYELAYSRPASLAEALALLEDDDGAQAISGGQTLMPVLRARLAMPSRLVDLARLGELRGISQSGDRIQIGGAMTHAEVAADPVVLAHLPGLARLAGGIGDPQVRHRGTIGGSVANNDPAACYPAALLALDAEVVTNRRTLDAQAFFLGMFATALEAGEIVTAIRFPGCRDAAYIKFRNPASRFALIGVFAARLDGGYRIAVTGSGNGVFRWSEAERHLDAGGSIDALSDVPLAAELFTGDMHGSAEYRRHITRVVSGRVLEQLF